jgi:hypothetical protein
MPRASYRAFPDGPPREASDTHRLAETDDPRLNARAPFTEAERVLAVLLGFGAVLGLLLSPLGVETRRTQLRSPLFAAFFIIVGMLMPLAALVLLLRRRPRPAAALAMADAGLLLLTSPADQAKFFFRVPPPPAVTAGELVLTLLGMGYMVYGLRVLREEASRA